HTGDVELWVIAGRRQPIVHHDAAPVLHPEVASPTSVVRTLSGDRRRSPSPHPPTEPAGRLGQAEPLICHRGESADCRPHWAPRQRWRDGGDDLRQQTYSSPR